MNLQMLLVPAIVREVIVPSRVIERDDDTGHDAVQAHKRRCYGACDEAPKLRIPAVPLHSGSHKACHYYREYSCNDKQDHYTADRLAPKNVDARDAGYGKGCEPQDVRGA